MFLLTKFFSNKTQNVFFNIFFIYIYSNIREEFFFYELKSTYLTSEG